MRNSLLSISGSQTLMPMPFPLEHIRPRIDNSPFALSLLSAIWLCMIILVNPIGNFPLHDDWAFGWTVRTWLEAGEFRLSDWNATNSLSQIVLGSLFCLPLGFSFTTLRFLTLAFGLLGALVSYGLLRQVGGGRSLAVLGAMLIVVNPLYFNLANSFMTDVPSFTFFVLALFCLICGLRRRSPFIVGLGLFLSCVAVLNRQSNLIIIPAFSLAYLRDRGVRLRSIGHVILVNMIVLVVYISYPQWLKLTGRTPFLYNLQIDQLTLSIKGGVGQIGITIFHNVATIAIYLGLFLLPFLLVIAASQYRNLSARQKQFGVWPISILVGAASLFVATHHPMPLAGNILNVFNLGGESIPGYDAFLSRATRTGMGRAWQGMTVIGVVGAALLTVCSIFAVLQFFYYNRRPDERKMGSGSEKQWKVILVGAVLAMYCLPICILNKQYWFDRYLILCLPLMMMFATLSVTGGKLQSVNFMTIGCIMTLVLFYAGATIAGTHDYLASNRVRWQAISYAMRELQIPPSQIDGGFEFEGWYFANSLAICNPGGAATRQATEVEFSTFTCLDDDPGREYAVSYVQQAGYSIEKQYSFSRWLPRREQKLYLLRRTSATPRE
jgi:hypothetical protein